MEASANSAALKIMTVEDSQLISDRIEEILDDVAGVRFVGNAASVSDALALIEQRHPDILVLDIKLGKTEEQTGIDLLFIVNHRYPSMKIIMLTNLSTQTYRTLCARGGADFFLDKSQDFDKIPDTLEQIVKQMSSSSAPE